MNTWAFLLVLMIAVVVSAVSVRPFLKRRRLVKRLLECEANVADAVADGRVPAATGEALLQHLEGLRRECSGIDGG